MDNLRKYIDDPDFQAAFAHHLKGGACEGCARGLTLVEGVHLDADNLAMIACTAGDSERTPSASNAVEASENE